LSFFGGVVFLTAWAGIASVASASTGNCVNPSFEADGIVALDVGNATGWADNIASPFGGGVSGTAYHTDGALGAVLSSKPDGAFSAGSNAYLKQSVDLSGVSTVQFDAQLTADYNYWAPFLEASVYVDSTKKWSKQLLGTYANQSVDVSGMSGKHTIEFRLEASTAGSVSGVSSSYAIDNVRVNPVPEPLTLTLLVAGSLGLAGYGWQRRRRAARESAQPARRRAIR
jgi:hypothetical protein